MEKEFKVMSDCKNSVFESMDNNPRGNGFGVSERRENELCIEEFNDCCGYWCNFMMSVLGVSGPVSSRTRPWMYDRFVDRWNDFVKSVNGIDRIISSRGSEEEYERYISEWDVVEESEEESGNVRKEIIDEETGEVIIVG